MKLQKGMTAIVTGGVSGLGEATTKDLLARGMNVVAVDLNDERGNAMQSQYPGQLRYVKADVADMSGNLRFNKTARNFNPAAAMAGKVTAAPVERVVPVSTWHDAPVDEPGLRALLDDVRAGAISPDDAVAQLRRLPFSDVPGATVDVYANGNELLKDFEPGTLTDPQMLPAGDYDLTRTGPVDATDGDLDLSGELTIRGAGPSATTVRLALGGGRYDQVISLRGASTKVVRGQRCRPW